MVPLARADHHSANVLTKSPLKSNIIPIVSNLPNCNLELSSSNRGDRMLVLGTLVWPVVPHKLGSGNISKLIMSSEQSYFFCSTAWKPCLPPLANNACAPPSSQSLKVWSYQVSAHGHRKLWESGGKQQAAQIQLWPRPLCAQLFRDGAGKEQRPKKSAVSFCRIT